MSEVQQTIDPAALWATIEAQHAVRATLAEGALPTNKAALFDALAAVGINSVLVTFDGVGDSGHIECIDAAIDGAPAELPGVEIEIATPAYDGSGLDRQTYAMPEAIETLADRFLEKTHRGWEINEGAYGEFTFTVANRTITLDYNERIETSEFHGHER